MKRSAARASRRGDNISDGDAAGGGVATAGAIAGVWTYGSGAANGIYDVSTADGVAGTAACAGTESTAAPCASQPLGGAKASDDNLLPANGASGERGPVASTNVSGGDEGDPTRDAWPALRGSALCASTTGPRALTRRMPTISQYAILSDFTGEPSASECESAARLTPHATAAPLGGAGNVTPKASCAMDVAKPYNRRIGGPVGTCRTSRLSMQYCDASHKYGKASFGRCCHCSTFASAIAARRRMSLLTSV